MKWKSFAIASSVAFASHFQRKEEYLDDCDFKMREQFSAWNSAVPHALSVIWRHLFNLSVPAFVHTEMEMSKSTSVCNV